MCIAYVMAERRRSAHAGDDQNNGVTLSTKKTRDPQSSYLYRSVVLTMEVLDMER